MSKIVIIGNGAAANSAAETIRRHSEQASITMVAREDMPEYSACALPDCLAGWVDRPRLFIKRLEDYARTGINTRWGEEVEKIDVDRHLLISQRGEISYDQLILATGSRAIIPPVSGCELAGNFVVKTVADIDAIIAHKARQVVVVGSGNIGIEVAEALQIQGCQVTIVELMERILPRIFDEEPSSRITQILQSRGIQVLTGEKVLSIRGHERVEEVRTDLRSIPCDTVIWAAGVKQNVELASAAGVAIGELGGIKVDLHMHTTVEGIYACGDCIESMDRLTGFPTLSLLWPNAKRQGQVAALNIIGKETEYEGAVSLVVEDIYGLTAVSMGMTMGSLAGTNVRIIEGEDNKQYWRVLLLDDRIIGMQAIGNTSGLGSIMNMMKNRTEVSEMRQMISDPVLVKKLAWYLPAQKFLGMA